MTLGYQGACHSHQKPKHLSINQNHRVYLKCSKKLSKNNGRPDINNSKAQCLTNYINAKNKDRTKKENCPLQLWLVGIELQKSPLLIPTMTNQLTYGVSGSYCLSFLWPLVQTLKIIMFNTCSRVKVPTQYLHFVKMKMRSTCRIKSSKS